MAILSIFYSKWSRNTNLLWATTLTVGWLLGLPSVLPAAPNAALGQVASERGAGERASFLVETIRLESTRHAQTDIVLTELRLIEGLTYTEDELRAGRNRIVQLPFVSGAEFSLERGSSPGKFELVIEVVESKLWFLTLDLSTEVISEKVATGLTDEGNGSIGGAFFVGRRFFLGRSGVLTAALGGDEGDLFVEYSQYDLLERGVAFSLGYSISFCDEDGLDDDSQACSFSVTDIGLDPSFSGFGQTGNRQKATANLSVPLAPNQSLEAQVQWKQTTRGAKRSILQDSSEPLNFFEDLTETHLWLGWSLDTLDDPVTPTSGRRVVAAVQARKWSGEFGLGLAPENSRLDTSSTEFGLAASVVQYRPVALNHALFFFADGFFGESEWEDLPVGRSEVLNDHATSIRAKIGLGHAAQLWRSRSEKRFGDLRLESDLSWEWNGTSPNLNLPGGRNPLRMARASTSLVYRNRLTVLRFSLAYRELLGDGLTNP